ncbi:MAG: hypothetical protein LBK66_05380 [Spirochaetaceae bacterium]|nr:hypothetical protein [Spirochaetaceae bacterium]
MYGSTSGKPKALPRLPDVLQIYVKNNDFFFFWGGGGLKYCKLLILCALPFRILHAFLSVLNGSLTNFAYFYFYSTYILFIKNLNIISLTNRA